MLTDNNKTTGTETIYNCTTSSSSDLDTNENIEINKTTGGINAIFNCCCRRAKSLSSAAAINKSSCHCNAIGIVRNSPFLRRQRNNDFSARNLNTDEFKMQQTNRIDRVVERNAVLIEQFNKFKWNFYRQNPGDDHFGNVDVKSLKKFYLLNQDATTNGNATRNKQNEQWNGITRTISQRKINCNRNIVKHLCRSFDDLTIFRKNSISASDCLNSKKSSFSKFDALQKKNILHVRSSDAGKAQEKFSDGPIEMEKKCRACGKVVYKMEEMKAERNIWHRNCFRCSECSKPLSVDTYESHESVLYCKQHFRQLLAPKAVEDNEPVKPRKTEMIIRENQPLELPPDVVRASDKPDLGLDELHQLNVKSRFQVFENYNENAAEERGTLDRTVTGVKRSATILSKLAKFHAKGMDTGLNDETLNGIAHDSADENGDDPDNDDDDDDIDDDNEDADLIRAKRAQRERPISFNNMNDIKTKFESGYLMTREDRREERKQEIQNIRSRLFMGKQAKIKEMYQQAVAESEQGITSTGKKSEIEIGDMAKSIKEKFEKGEIFNRNKTDETDEQKLNDEDMAVFEQGISKKSRSIFMELDASQQHQQALLPGTPRTPDSKKHSQVRKLPAERHKPFHTGSDEIVKCDDKSDDIKIETSEISSKFKFFETYRPTETEKKQFRITPPRDGVVKMSSPDRELYIDPGVVRADTIGNKSASDDPSVAEKSHTASKMLSIFRKMEETTKQNGNDVGLKPLKCFTPPPDDNRRIFQNRDSDDEEDDDEEGEEEEEEDEDDEDGSDGGHPIIRYEDETLKQAQLAARAKQLRAKFEKWEANEIRREMNSNNYNNNSAVNLYENCDENEEGQVESAKSLRAKFESLRDTNNSPSRPRVQVNRFV